MNAERLLAHFERISEAPDAIARLRSFILDLAVRGKLVEQEPEDEPVPLLLDEIKSRMRRLSLKHAFSVIDPSEIPFDEPSGWTWCRLGEVCEKTGSGSTPRGGKDVYSNSGILFLRSQNIYNDGLRLDDVAFIDVQTHERMAGTRVLPCDLLLNITGGSIGRCAKMPLDFGEANISQHVAIIRVAARGMEEFFHSLILSPYFQVFVDKSQTGAGRGGLPKNRMDSIPVPLPPLAEQHRIVAKVDELMALCDQLEAARQQRDHGRKHLLAATLQRLNQSTKDPASFRKDASFALQVLPSLTTTPAQIKQLRQTILNLAVRGKLVEQDPEDEPVEAYLRLINAKPAERGDFWVPRQWAWVSVGEVSMSRLGKMLDKAKNKGTERPYLRNINVRWLDFDLSDLLEMRFEDSELAEYELRKGDVLICEGGEPGRAAVWDDRARDIYFQKAIHRVRFDECVNPFFFVHALRCSAQNERLFRYFTGTGISHFTGKSLKAYLFPLPPLAEQHRIVAKVDTLLALCDQLEQQLSQADQQRRRLLEAVLAEALGGRLPTAQEESHAAIA